MLKKYSITTMTDFYAAKKYLSRAMQREDSGISKFEGYNDFKYSASAVELQNWCESYLSEEQFKKLRQSVRAINKRSRDSVTGKGRKTIDISFSAYFDLKELKTEFGGIKVSELLSRLRITYDDWLECGYTLNKHVFKQIMSGADIDELKQKYEYMKSDIF